MPDEFRGDWTPTTDVFGRFIEGLKMGREARKAEEQRAKDILAAKYEAQKQEYGDPKTRLDIMARSDGAFSSLKDVEQALQWQKSMRSLPEAMTGPVPTTGPARPFASEAEQLAPLQYAQGLEKLARPSFSFETQELPGGLGQLVLPKTYTGMPKVVQPQRPAGTGAALRPPTGYRYTAEGDLEVIPGGPVAQERAQAAAKVEERLGTQRASIANILPTIERASKEIDALTAGPLGQVLSNVGGTRAANLESAIKTVQANLGFDRLTQMRAESPTGGALGQVSNVELDLLTSAVSNLSQKQSPQSLRDNMANVQKHLNNWLQLMEQYAEERKRILQPAKKGARGEKDTGTGLFTEDQKAKLRARIKQMGGK